MSKRQYISVKDESKVKGNTISRAALKKALVT